MRCLIFFIFLTLSGSSHGHELAEDYKTVYAIYQEGCFSSAKEEALKLLPIAKQENNAFYLVKLYFLLGYLATHTDDYGNAILYYLDGARVAEHSDGFELQTTLISIYKNLALVLGNFQHFDLSHKFINRGLEVAIKLGNTDQIKSLLENRIHELIEEERYHDALFQIDSLQSLFELKGKSLLKMKNTAGISYTNMGEIDSAISNYLYVIDHGREIDPETFSYSIQNLANIYRERNNYYNALHLYQEQIKVASAEGLNQLLFQALKFTGFTYFLKGEPILALRYLDQALLLDEAGDLEPDAYTLYETLATVYESMGDLEKALHYSTIYTQRLETFVAEQRQIAQLSRKYQIQLLAQKHLDLLVAKDKQQEVESKVKVALGMAGVILLLLGLGIYYRHHPTKA